MRRNILSFRLIPFAITSLLALGATLPNYAHAQTGYKLQRLITESDGPFDIAVGRDGMVYTGGYSGITVRKTSGEFVKTITNTAVASAVRASYFLPTALEIDRTGDLHVLSFSDPIVARFRNGTLISSFAVNGNGSPDMVAGDMAVARDGSYFIITNPTPTLGGTDRLQKHDASGRLLFSIPRHRISGNPTATLEKVALSAYGDVHILVRTDTNATVEVFSSSGRYLRRLQMPSNASSGEGISSAQISNIASGENGNILVNSEYGSLGLGVLVTFSPTGSVVRTSIGGATGPTTASGLSPHFSRLKGMSFDQFGNMYALLYMEDIAVYRPAPAARIFFKEVSGIDSGSAAQFSFATLSASDRFECSLDQAPFAECAGQASYSGLSQGRHVFRVRVRGNSGSVESYRWTIQ